MNATVSKNNTESGPKRKRLRIDARVSFQYAVHVRAEIDVDRLRWSASTLSEVFLEDDHSTLNSVPGSFDITPLKTNTTPKRPRQVCTLKSYDGSR
jgi:hypothetical protein